MRLENIITIPLFERNEEGKLVKVGEEKYTINYIKSKHPDMLRIVVNGVAIDKRIHMRQHNNGKGRNSGYKSKLLKAIGMYINRPDKETNKVAKEYVTIEYVKTTYAKQWYFIKHFLLPINKETNRDNLTRHGIYKPEFATDKLPLEK